IRDTRREERALDALLYVVVPDDVRLRLGRRAEAPLPGRREPLRPRDEADDRKDPCYREPQASPLPRGVADEIDREGLDRRVPPGGVVRESAEEHAVNA